jgi:hypothetical protein
MAEVQKLCAQLFGTVAVSGTFLLNRKKRGVMSRKADRQMA